MVFLEFHLSCITLLHARIRWNITLFRRLPVGQLSWNMVVSLPV